MLPYKILLVYTTEIERVETIKLQTKTLIFGFIELNAYVKQWFCTQLEQTGNRTSRALKSMNAKLTVQMVCSVALYSDFITMWFTFKMS